MSATIELSEEEWRKLVKRHEERLIGMGLFTKQQLDGLNMPQRDDHQPTDHRLQNDDEFQTACSICFWTVPESTHSCGISIVDHLRARVVLALLINNLLDGDEAVTFRGLPVMVEDLSRDWERVLRDLRKN